MATPIEDHAPDTPTILGCQPSFHIDSYEAAVAHYVDWLGFNLDWEWRAEPNQPVIMSVTRDGLSLFLNEAGDEATGTTLRVQVLNLEGIANEWNEKRPGAVEVFLEQPYEIPTAYVKDPFGNVLALQQPQSEEEAAAKRATSERIRHYLKGLVDSGSARPTPKEIVRNFGGSLGIASEVLAEFTEWKAVEDA